MYRLLKGDKNPDYIPEEYGFFCIYFYLRKTAKIAQGYEMRSQR